MRQLHIGSSTAARSSSVNGSGWARGDPAGGWSVDGGALEHAVGDRSEDVGEEGASGQAERRYRGRASQVLTARL